MFVFLWEENRAAQAQATRRPNVVEAGHETAPRLSAYISFVSKDVSSSGSRSVWTATPRRFS